VLQPTGLVDTLSGTMLVTSLYCAARLVAARVWRRPLHRDTNLAHMADAVAMAGMLDGTFKTLPNAAWDVVFAFFTLWFAVRGTRFVLRHGLGAGDHDHVHHVSHYLSHLVMAGAMLYMFLEASPSAAGSVTGSMAAMGGAGTTSNLTGLTLLLVVALFASAVWHADGLTRYTTIRPPLVSAGVAATANATAAPFSDATMAAPVPPVDAAGADAAGVDGPPWLAPRLETGCHIALCITMGYMLILLL
jgi:hypothetical protein